MTPGARAAAAAGILDAVLGGSSAERALTAWGRDSRYAGSGDRAAVRDLVFSALRRRRSAGWAGGGDTGRALVLGLARGEGSDVARLFTGPPFAPDPPRPAEAEPEAPMPELVALDCPDWLAPPLRASLGAAFAPVLEELRHRAPVFLRVNLARTTRATAARMIAAEGIETVEHVTVQSSLEITANARKIRTTRAYLDGLVEVQDAASQAAVLALGEVAGLRVRDVCAGGGGKALALSARGARVVASDVDPKRMRDLPARAERAGARIEISDGSPVPCDLILIDAPCSGSGTWRRNPEAKWALDAASLRSFTETQAGLLRAHAAEAGRIAYMTCSILTAENDAVTAAFLASHPGWRIRETRSWLPSSAGDGFFLADLEKTGG